MLWHHGEVVITTAQLHSTNPELTFCAGSNPAHVVSEIGNEGMVPPGNKAKCLSSVNQTTKTFHHHHHHHHHHQCIHSHFISSLSRSERDSWITEASKAIIIAVKISERKASQRQREVFSQVNILYDLSNHLNILLLIF